MSGDGPLLDVRGVGVTFRRPGRREPFQAVDGVSLTIGPGETVALVGESGSGKTTLSRAILGLVAPAAGSIAFDGRDITVRTPALNRRISSELQAVFQDPYSSLNPTRTIGNSLLEPMILRKHATTNEKRERARTMLGRVGLAADAIDRFPGEFSGGQRQRIAIARALMASPRLIVCDEPVSALDLSVQAQILNLLMELQADLGLSYLFISHDLAVVRHIARRVVVMHHGNVMETGTAEAVCEHPEHPYTQRLVASGRGTENAPVGKTLG